jgi:hypothetical protein
MPGFLLGNKFYLNIDLKNKTFIMLRIDDVIMLLCGC